MRPQTNDDFTLVNPQPNYQPVELIEPPPLGYIHVAAAVEPPAGRIPRPGRGPEKQALLARRSYVLANLRANRTGSMPLLYRLA